MPRRLPPQETPASLGIAAGLVGLCGTLMPFTGLLWARGESEVLALLASPRRRPRYVNYAAKARRREKASTQLRAGLFRRFHGPSTGLRSLPLENLWSNLRESNRW